jgi:hypothetical protein
LEADVPIIEPTTRRERLLAWARRVAHAAVSDYRYPRALATALAAASVLVALVLTFYGVDRVLDRLDQRATYSECVDDREVEFEVALTDLVLSFGAVPPLSDDTERLLRDRLAVAADRLRSVGEPLVNGGCPGRDRET